MISIHFCISFLLGETAEGMGKMLKEDQKNTEHFIKASCFKKFIFNLQSSVELFGDIQRSKYTVQSVAPINHKEYNDHLIKNIQRLTGAGARRN